MHILGRLAKKVTLPWSNHILKIQWDIPFLKRRFLRRNAPKKFGIVIKYDFVSTAFGNNFGPREVPQPENA